MRPRAGGHEGAGRVQKSVDGTPRFNEPAAPSQALPAALPSHLRDALTDLAACEGRRSALAGAYSAPDVLADGLTIAAEGRPRGTQ
jgi:hypothetical protein